MDLYYENEEMSDSDSEVASQSSQENFVGDEKRQYHNVLEQKRRNILKTNFDLLMAVIPSLKKKGFVINDKKASRAKILKAAIQCLKRRNGKSGAHLRDIKNLEKDTESLQKYCLELRIAEQTGDLSNVESIFKSIDEVNARVYEDDSTDSEEEEEDDDDNNEEDIDDAESDPDNEGQEDQEFGYASDNCFQDAFINVSEESEASDSDESSELSSSDNE